MTYIAIGNNAGPASNIFPLSGQTASSAGILITGTTAAAQTTAHTSATGAWDAPYIIISNVGASTVTVFGQLGSTATTGQRQWSINAGSFTTAYSYDVMQSNSGVFGFWGTATAGIYVSGVVSRFFTASS